MATNKAIITPARARALLKRYAARPLAHGGHSGPDAGFCVMEKGWLLARARGLLPAVWSAAEKTLAPTVAQIQQSALGLLDRMIALSPVPVLAEATQGWW